MDFRKYRIERVEEKGGSVRTFLLMPLEGRQPSFQPGNFFLLMLRTAAGKPLFRPYSVASQPWEVGLLFCIKNGGEFTSLLFALGEGGEIEVDGPYGTFTLAAEDSFRVFIAGGVGISPLRGMALQSAAEGMPCALFQSAKEKSGLFFSEEFEGLAKGGRGFSYFTALTQEQPEGFGGIAGRITAERMKEKLGSLEGKAYYICGSKEMASQLATELIAAGVPKASVHKEEWG